MDDIVGVVNSHLSAKVLCDPRFDGAGLFTIAKTARRENEEYPIVFSANGEGMEVCPDDTYAIQIYHRVNSGSFGVSVNSVGDRSNVVNETISMKMVVAGMGSKINMIQENVIQLIASNFPDQTKDSVAIPLKLQNLTFVLKSFENNSKVVWSAEYQGRPYDLKPEQILFSMNYEISMQYQKGCFGLTDCQFNN